MKRSDIIEVRISVAETAAIETVREVGEAVRERVSAASSVVLGLLRRGPGY
jgi:hypothetical protein